MPYHRFFSLLVILATASVGLWALFAVLSAAPATNATIRAVAVSDWRRVSAAAFYDAGSFYREHGYIIVNDTLAEAQRSKGGLVTVPRDNILAARDLFSRSVAYNPGDALSWAGLAIVAAMLRDHEAYLDSMSQSADLAPYNLAIARVRLTGFVMIPDIALTEDLKAALRRDFQVARGKGGDMEKLLALAPFLAARDSEP
jgi:hypothetical protein